MATYRRFLWLLVLALPLGWGGKVGAQGLNEPNFSTGDAMYFAPPDPYPYDGGYRQPNTGHFVSWEWLHWNFQAPENFTFGAPEVEQFDGSVTDRPYVADSGLFRRAINTLDTTMWNSNWKDGQRFEFGYATRRYGWMFSMFKLKGNDHRISASNVEMIFQDEYTELPFVDFIRTNPAVPIDFTDPTTFFTILNSRNVGLLDGFINHDSNNNSVDDNLNLNDVWGRFIDGNNDGVINPALLADQLNPEEWDLNDLFRLAVEFDTFEARLRNEMWGCELMPFVRTGPFHKGGVLEFFAGVRYMRFLESFDVLATGGILDESFWWTRAENDLVGPQVAMRYFLNRGPWTISADGRFMAAANFQNIRQRGSLASNLSPDGPPGNITRAAANQPLIMSPLTFTNEADLHEFSPVVELRLMVSRQISKALSLRLGWTALYIDNIARPTHMVEYRLPTMGIRRENNRQDLITNGFNIGLELNR